jgi:hypothetical protein
MKVDEAGYTLAGKASSQKGFKIVFFHNRGYFFHVGYFKIEGRSFLICPFFQIKFAGLRKVIIFDYMNEKGHLTIRVRKDKRWVLVQLEKLAKSQDRSVSYTASDILERHFLRKKKIQK